MALTAKQFAYVRRLLRPFILGPVTYDTTEVDAAIQVVFDRIDSTATRTTLAGDIEGAAPGVFDAAAKKAIAAVTVEEFARHEKESL